MALRIAWPTLIQTLQQLPNRLRPVLEKLPRNLDEMGRTSRDIARELSLAQSTVRVYLSDLISLGYAYEDRMPGERAKRYWTSERNAKVLHSVKQAMQQLNWREIAAISKRASKEASSGSVASPSMNPNLCWIDPIDSSTIDILTLIENATPAKEGDKGEQLAKEANKSELVVISPGVTQCNSLTPRGLSQSELMSRLGKLYKRFCAGRSLTKPDFLAVVKSQLDESEDRLKAAIELMAQKGVLFKIGSEGFWPT